MAVRFFGQFLLENRVIRADQLLAALSYQDKANRRFGEVAVALGVLDASQVERLLALQRLEDLRAGEAAVRLGLLRPDQVEQVLVAQRNSHVLIGEALIAVGALTNEQLEQQLEAFQAEQRAMRASVQLPEGQDPSGLGRHAVDLGIKFLLRMVQIPALLEGCSTGAIPESNGAGSWAFVHFGGSWTGKLGMRTTPKVAAQIAEAILGEPVRFNDEPVLLDGLREFLNVLCGNLSAAVAREGHTLELQPPRTEDPDKTPRQHLLTACLRTPDGEVQLALLTRREAA